MDGLAWVRWKRYALVLGVDGQERAVVARFLLRDTAQRIADDLAPLKGIEAEVVDTKARGEKDDVAG